MAEKESLVHTVCTYMHEVPLGCFTSITTNVISPAGSAGLCYNPMKYKAVRVHCNRLHMIYLFQGSRRTSKRQIACCRVQFNEQACEYISCN